MIAKGCLWRCGSRAPVSLASLVHFQDRFRLTGYSNVHENSDLCTSVVGRRARKPRKGAALQEHFHHAPLADASCQLQGRACPEDRPEPRMRLANGARCSIHDFNERGVLALEAKSSRPNRTRDAFDQHSAEALREMLHRSPREFGRESSLWTLEMAADVAFEEGLTPERVSGETIRATLSRLLSVRWMRAKRWITSPDPLYERKKGGATD
jgi:hypothetical protein